MDQKSGQENMAVEERWPLWRDGRYGGLTVKIKSNLEFILSYSTYTTNSLQAQGQLSEKSRSPAGWNSARVGRRPVR